MAHHVLLIGNRADVLDELQRGLVEDGYGCSVSLKMTRSQVRQTLERALDAIIVDLPVEGFDAPHLCRRIRAHTDAPIVLICPENCDEQDRIGAFEAGADDCLVKPASAGLVVAHLRARMQRTTERLEEAAPNGLLDFGELKIDIPRREVLVRGETPHLTPKEFDLLATLALSAGRPLKTAELLEDVWGYNQTCSTRTLDVHVSRLRSKIERDSSDPEFIVTVPCIGYKFRDPKKA